MKEILDISPSSELCKVNNTCSGEEKNDVEITEICDDDSVPVTVINSESTNHKGQNIENRPYKDNGCDKQSDIDCSKKTEIVSCISEGEFEPPTPPPVTYIGDPADALAEYERRRAEGTQAAIEPIDVGNEIVEVKYSGSEPSVIVENCASGYVVLPGELVRRKSSLRRENAQVHVYSNNL
jgi:hypothetical protein